jgi:uridine kinase
VTGARRVPAAEAPAALLALLEERPLREPVAFVGLDGGGGAGKSTLARAVAARRGDVRVLRLDDFFQSVEAFADSIDLERLEREALAPLREGRPARFRRFDWHSLGLEEWREVAPGRIVIVEGVFALQPALRPLYDVTAWLETDTAIRLRRGLERDGAEAEPMWRDWQANEDRHRAEVEPESTVDLIVLG